MCRWLKFPHVFPIAAKAKPNHMHTHTQTDNLTHGKTKGDAAQPQSGPSAGRPTQVLCRLLPLQLQQDSTRDNQPRQRLRRRRLWRRLRLRLELLLLLRTQSCVSSFFFFHRVFLFNPVSSTLLARPFVRRRRHPLLPPLAQVPSRAREIKNSKSQRRKQREQDTESERERERTRMRENECRVRERTL